MSLPVFEFFLTLLPIGIIMAPPAYLILRRLGFSGWWTLAFIPFPLLAPWVLAFVAWPKERLS